MATEISKVVDVTVSSSTRPISVASFSKALFIAKHNVFTERWREYTSSASAEADGFDSNSPVVQYLEGAFGGRQAPNSVVVGRVEITDVDLTIGDVAEDDVFSLTVKVGDSETDITYTADGTDTSSTVATELTTLLDAITGVGASAATNVVTITPDDVDVSLSIYEITSNITAQYNATETYSTAWAAIKQVLTTDTFFLGVDSKANADVIEAFDIAQAEDMFVTVATGDTDSYDSTSTTDIGAVLKNNNYENGLVMYNTLAATSYRPAGSIIGEWAATNAGTVTLNGIDLVGVPSDNLSETQQSVLDSKNINYQVSIAGSGFFFNGNCPNGEFADLVRFKLWLKARVGEAVFALLKRKNASTGTRILYTTGGQLIIEQTIAEPLDLAYTLGATTLDDDGNKYIIVIPDQTANDQASRILNNVEFEVVYAGAIHKVIIRGYVTL